MIDRFNLEKFIALILYYVKQRLTFYFGNQGEAMLSNS